MDCWRLIVSPAAPGARNLAVDQAIAESVQAGRAPPTLRFYTWSPRALSLGYFQPLADIDRALARKLGVDLVRRPTGGQAILHNDELTYAVALPRGHALALGGVLASYAAINQGLVAGLEDLGLSLQLGKPESAAEPPESGLCFASRSYHEIAVAGHKIVGGAQCRVRRGLLQHGSIALTHDPDIYPLMRRARPETVPPALRALLSTPHTVGALVQAFLQGFATRLHLGIQPDGLTADEAARADELVRTRYASDAWLKRR